MSARTQTCRFSVLADYGSKVKVIAYSSRIFYTLNRQTQQDILAKNQAMISQIAENREKTLSPASFDTFRGVSEKRKKLRDDRDFGQNHIKKTTYGVKTLFPDPLETAALTF